MKCKNLLKWHNLLNKSWFLTKNRHFILVIILTYYVYLTLTQCLTSVWWHLHIPVQSRFAFLHLHLIEWHPVAQWHLIISKHVSVISGFVIEKVHHHLSSILANWDLVERVYIYMYLPVSKYYSVPWTSRIHCWMHHSLVRTNLQYVYM